ncbi:MAG: hypothetical protein KIS87_04770 [Phycisphaeraceae bacterium]|nr:hypothetical protein [Phycisphaeraceae bacterium]
MKVFDGQRLAITGEENGRYRIDSLRPPQSRVSRIDGVFLEPDWDSAYDASSLINTFSGIMKATSDADLDGQGMRGRSDLVTFIHRLHPRSGR